MKLVHSIDGREVQVGDQVTSFRGEQATVTDIEKPHKPASTGRVYVTFKNGTKGGYYPSVFELEWIEREDRK